MKAVNTYTANIYVGLRPGYEDVSEDVLKENKHKVIRICQEYCDDVGLCVTITDTEFIYTKGNEPGIIIGLINYPRFPSNVNDIRKLAIELAQTIQPELKQKRITIVFPDKTFMIGENGYESNKENREDGD